MHIDQFFQGWRYQEVGPVLLVSIVSVALWRVPIVGLFFYPFHIFGTFVHELSHGLAAVLTGGEFRRFVVNLDQSGTAWSAGGIRWIITSAGYVGSAVFGGLLIIMSARDVPAHYVLTALGIALGVLCLIFVRNLFGVVAGLILAGLLVYAGEQLSGSLWADRLLLLLAVQMALHALNSVFNLVWLSTNQAGVRTDAQIMQDMTHIPAPFWAFIWTVLSCGILVLALHTAYRSPSGLP
jgi:hypothetical protein